MHILLYSQLGFIFNQLHSCFDVRTTVLSSSPDCLTDIRQNLAAPRLVGKQDSVAKLAELLSNMQSSVVEQIKSVLNNLQACCTLKCIIFADLLPSTVY